jgi:cytosine deaminase
MTDLLVRDATLPDGRAGVDILCAGGRIAAIGPRLDATAARTLAAGGLLVAPPFVDAHFHMDSTLTWGMPRVNASGTLLEGIALWGELKPTLVQDAIVERALAYCDWAVAKGLLAIRSHVDTSDPRLLAVEALLDVRARVKPYLDLQLVAFPQDGLLRSPGALHNLKRALDLGVDVVGGIPHFERTMADGAESVRVLCDLAADRGLRVDMHCDETDDPLSRHVETLAYHAQRLKLHGRVAGSHLTSMHSMDNYYASKLIPLMREAGVAAIANPLINITLQGRHDSYPKRRGMTRVPELLAAGVPVAFGHDCVMDPWYPLGSADMLEVASMGLHVAQMTGTDAMRACFDAVTATPAAILGLDDYGLEAGKRADFVLLHARDPVEAIRLKAARLAVAITRPPRTTASRAGARRGAGPAGSAGVDRPARAHRREALTGDRRTGMAMVKLVEVHEAPPEVRAVYDDIMRTRGTDWINNFWKALANHPPTLERVWRDVKQVMAPGALDPLVKELVYVAVSVTNDCEYCIRSHAAAARAKGMTDAQFAELLAVVGLANQTNRLAAGYRIPVDERFVPHPDR